MKGLVCKRIWKLCRIGIKRRRIWRKGRNNRDKYKKRREWLKEWKMKEGIKKFRIGLRKL